MLPAFAHHPRVRLVACADVREEARARFAAEFPGAAAHGTVEALCADPSVEAVYLATPHGHHAAQAVLAARAGRHVLVEKPMAVTLEEARAMVAAHARAGTVLMVGHSHGQDGPVRHARRLVAGGRFGAPRLVAALNCTDFLRRPRRAEELDTRQGGGVVFSQAAHQLDVVRVLAGGLLRSLRAQTLAARGTEGAYAAFMAFAGGAATATYSGLGRFDSDAWMGGIGELGAPKPPGAPSPRRDPAEEAAAKLARAYGAGPPGLPPAAAPAHHNHFGVVLVQCDGADLRLTADGVEIHEEGGARFEPTPLPALPRAEVLDEFAAAIRDGVPPRHDGAWGLATLEACLAILASARDGREVPLTHQVPFKD